jgi:hypothetical protein
MVLDTDSRVIALEFFDALRQLPIAQQPLWREYQKPGQTAALACRVVLPKLGKEEPQAVE